MEELKGPLLTTPYCPTYISAAAWSPTRAVLLCFRHLVLSLLGSHNYRDTWLMFVGAILLPKFCDASTTAKISA